MIEALRLPNAIDLANDPFFGRGGKIVANSQREQNPKFELLIPIEHDDRQTACLSFNYHMDHFGLWDIRTATGDVAHTGCVGFGLERLTLALFRHHGFDIEARPREVRDVPGHAMRFVSRDGEDASFDDAPPRAPLPAASAA